MLNMNVHDKLNKKSIAVIRAIDIRVSQAEYASHFKKFNSFYLSNYNKEIKDYLKNKSTKYISLDMKHMYFIDPFKFIYGKTVHQSWLVFKQKELERALKQVDYYQIQEPFFLYSGQVAEVSKKYDKPLIMAPWMCFNHPSTYIPPYSFGVTKSINQTDLFIIRTNKVNDYLSLFKLSDKKKVLIYHGVNTKRFYPSNKKDDDKVRILFVGVLDESKGLNDILDIFPELIKLSKRKLELIICGIGNLEKKVIEMSKSLPIKYLGQVSNLNLPEIYRKSDIFCGPSKDIYSMGFKRWEEGFGFVFVESMASGLPIVTNDCGAIKEVVGDDNFVNRQGDKKKLKDSLLELINDDNIRKSIGAKNRIRALEMFDLEKQVSKEEKEIEKHFG
jgi:glycosyltransferase involved in cell wall biosynthesis